MTTGRAVGCSAVRDERVLSVFVLLLRLSRLLTRWKRRFCQREVMRAQTKRREGGKSAPGDHELESTLVMGSS
jgi:hypothetical protein